MSRLDMLSPKSSLKKRSNSPFLLVDSLDVRCAKRLHDFAAEHVMNFDRDEQVIMIGHEAVRKNIDPFAFEILLDLSEKETPVSGLEEDILAVDAAIIQVIDVIG